MKLGIFGGTFDPVHREHLAVITAAAKASGADEILLLPAPNPPHKSGHITDYSVRKKMLSAFVSDAAAAGVKARIDETETEFYPEPSYAYKTLNALRVKYPSDELIYIIGSDSLFKFDTWKHPELVAAAAPICVVPRGKAEGVIEKCRELNAKYPGARFFSTDGATEGISSSGIRFLTETGEAEATRALLTPSVFELIQKEGLYREYSAIVEKLKSDIPAGLFRHSLNTAEWATEHAWLDGVPFGEAFVAALLHDNAKPYSPMFGEENYPLGTARQVTHQYDGAIRAREVYGITDENVLNAIKYHTTARPDMSGVEKLVYLGDKLEKGRDYPGIDELRAAAAADTDSGMAALLGHTVGYLKERSETPDILTNAAYEWYNSERRQNGR